MLLRSRFQGHANPLAHESPLTLMRHKTTAMGYAPKKSTTHVITDIRSQMFRSHLNIFIEPKIVCITFVLEILYSS